MRGFFKIPITLSSAGVIRIIKWTLFAYAMLFGVACASTANRQKEAASDRLVDAELNKMQIELESVCEVIRPNRTEVMIRFNEDVLFNVDEYSLRPSAEQSLTEIIEILKKYPEFIIIVEGHTDDKGREGYNQWLSEKRSHMVAGFCVEKGLDPNRIQVIGYGESQPCANNKTLEGRKRNRRVELHIIPGGS